MNSEIILQAAKHTLKGTQSFPQIVKDLITAGVEYYHVDYITLCKTFYSEKGAAMTTAITFEDLPSVSADFDAPALKAAILDSQLHGQSFRDFTRRAMLAGVQGYHAHLRGRRVIYSGRQGDQHTEWFPES